MVALAAFSRVVAGVGRSLAAGAAARLPPPSDIVSSANTDTPCFELDGIFLSRLKTSPLKGKIPGSGDEVYGQTFMVRKKEKNNLFISGSMNKKAHLGNNKTGKSSLAEYIQHIVGWVDLINTYIL